MTQTIQDKQQCNAMEWAVLLVILAAFVVVNLVSASRSPTVWTDEVMLTNPPANLYFGHGFHSTAYDFETKEQSYIGNGMAYEGLLYGWIKVFGFGPTAVRSLNFVLMALATVMICAAARRSGVVPTPAGRIILAVLLLCGWGITFSFRSGRYDILGTAVVAAAFLASTVRRPALRFVLLGLIGVVMMWTGVQLAPFAAGVGVAILLVVGKKAIPPLAATAVGALAGLISLYITLKSRGQWEALTSFSNGGMVTPSAAHRVISAIMGLRHVPTLDFSMTILMALMIVALVAARSKIGWRSPVTFGLLAGILVPLALLVAGHYPVYYTWMAFVPGAIGAAAAWDLFIRPHANRGVRAAGAGLLLLACVIGLPMRLGLTALEWHQRSYAPVEKLVNENVTANDWVYSDYAGFYPAISKARWVFFEPYLRMMSDEDKRRISVLIIDPSNFAHIHEAIGGEWQATGEALTPPPAARGLVRRLGAGARLYSLAIYRRVANHPS